jgi:branched-chain amino acid transport system ATP-binding protein
MLRFEEVYAGYGQGDILRGVDLELERGSITCVIGPNGAGKSTVLRVLSGLLKPRAGAVRLEDRPIHGLSPAAILEQGIVHVPQDRSLFPLMTVWDNLLIGGHSIRDRALVRRRADEVAERFPIIRERRNERAGALSGGQQKLIEIARALMLEPRLVLLDEPTMGLDAKSRHAVFETIEQLNEGGRTVLLVEQNARLGLSISDVGAVMDMGVVRLVGPGAALLDDPRVAELYLGGAPREEPAGEARTRPGWTPARPSSASSPPLP